MALISARIDVDGIVYLQSYGQGPTDPPWSQRCDNPTELIASLQELEPAALTAKYDAHIEYHQQKIDQAEAAKEEALKRKENSK